MLQLRYKSESNGIHMFKDQLEQHIKELKIEFKAGQKTCGVGCKTGTFTRMGTTHHRYHSSDGGRDD